MELTKWNNAKNAIAECKTIDEVKAIRDKAEALRQYAKQAKESLLVQNDIAEIKLRAERRVGEMLKGEELAKNQYAGNMMSLAKIGIEKHESSRWQKEADIPEDVFEEHVKEVKNKNIELTQAGLLKIHKDLEKEKRNIKLKSIKTDIPKGLYDVIYADPPSQYEHLVDPTRDIENHYITDDIKSICDLKFPIHDNAILFLWVPPSLIASGLKVCEAWGFSYRTHIIWDKEIIGMGYFTRAQHELLFIARKGNINAPLPENRISSIYREKRTNHSKKPEYFYKLIEKCYPREKYLELYARNKYSDKWDVWGNEV